MTRVSQRYVIDGKDNTAKARKSAEKGFFDLDKSVQSLSASLKGGATVAATFVGVFASKALKDGLNELSNIQRQMGRISGVIQATGGAAGITAGEIREMADAIALTTLENENNVREAAAQLLTFRNITGDVFRRTIDLSADLAELGFGSIQRSSVQLAKALEDPVRGLGRLRLVGVSFTKTQEDIIKGFAENNQLVEAQTEILDVLASQVENVAEAANVGLAGALDTAGQRYRQFTSVLAETTVYSTAVDAVNKFSDALVFFRQLIAPTTDEIVADLEEKLARTRAAIEGGKGFIFGGSLYEDAVKRAQEVSEALFLAKQARDAERDSIRLAREEMEKEAAARKEEADEANKVVEQEKEKLKLAKETADAKKAFLSGLEKESKTLVRDVNSLAKEAEFYARIGDETIEIREHLARISELQDLGVLPITQAEQAAAMYAEQLRQVTEESDKLKEKTSEITPEARNLGFTFQSAFEDAILEAKNLREVLKGLIKDLGRAVLRQFTEPAFTAVGGAVASFISGKQHGGPVMANQPYVVGERGPELFIPHTSGKIDPNVGSGVTVNQSFDFTNANPATIALLRQEAASIQENTIMSLIELRQSGALPNF